MAASAALLLAVATPARAQPAADLAREETKRGGAAYALGRYDEAARHYEQAFRLVPGEASLLFNIAQSYRMGGQPEKALTAYRSYLRAAGPNASSRAVAEQKMAELERAAAATSHPTTALPPTNPAAVPVARAAPSLPSVPPAAAPVVVSPASAAERPYYKRGLFWGGVGVAVAAGIVAALLVTRRSEDPIRGDVDPGVVVLR